MFASVVLTRTPCSLAWTASWKHTPATVSKCRICQWMSMTRIWNAVRMQTSGTLERQSDTTRWNMYWYQLFLCKCRACPRTSCIVVCTAARTRVLLGSLRVPSAHAIGNSLQTLRLSVGFTSDFVPILFSTSHEKNCPNVALLSPDFGALLELTVFFFCCASIREIRCCLAEFSTIETGVCSAKTRRPTTQFRNICFNGCLVDNNRNKVRTEMPHDDMAMRLMLLIVMMVIMTTRMLRGMRWRWDENEDADEYENEMKGWGYGYQHVLTWWFGLVVWKSGNWWFCEPGTYLILSNPVNKSLTTHLK